MDLQTIVYVLVVLGIPVFSGAFLSQQHKGLAGWCYLSASFTLFVQGVTVGFREQRWVTAGFLLICAGFFSLKAWEYLLSILAKFLERIQKSK